LTPTEFVEKYITYNCYFYIHYAGHQVIVARRFQAAEICGQTYIGRRRDQNRISENNRCSASPANTTRAVQINYKLHD